MVEKDTGSSHPLGRNLFVFSPLPPARNGIADYAIRFMRGMSSKYDITAFCNTPFVSDTVDFKLIHESFAFEYVSETTRLVYQIGNNHDHVFVLKWALKYPGIVLLHDPRLLHLYQVSGAPPEKLHQVMKHSNTIFGESLASVDNFRGPQRVDHVIFDGLSEVLNISRGIVVHSNFARNLILWHYGELIASKVSVIPPFAYSMEPQSREAARSILSIDRDAFVIVTAGFAHQRKRYEWLARAIEILIFRSRRRVVWVQAGEVKEDSSLFEILNESDSLRDICHVTGYISEERLDSYTIAADVLVNLRFPSDGENSASLLRAFGAGICCIVSDTASYSEIPNDVAVKIPVVEAVPALSEALVALSEDPSLRDAFGRSAARYASEQLSINLYSDRFENFVETVYNVRHVFSSINPIEPE